MTPAGHIHDVTVPDYGATGDGRTNDREAIQAAIDAVAAAGGGTVLLPDGGVYLSGNLVLDSEVTLRVDGTLRQSQDPSHHTFEPLLGHRKRGRHQSYITWFDNLPLVFARNCRNVAVTGSGSIEMTHAADDTLEFRDDTGDSPLTYLPGERHPLQRGIGVDYHTIHQAPLALYEVDGFDVSGIKILYGNTHNLLIYSCRNGVVRDTTVRVYPTEESYGQHHVANTDGVHVQNSQSVRITGNDFDQIDNSVVIIARYADPRAGTFWWNTDTPRPTSHIEIDNNSIKTSHGAVVLLPWAPGAPDLAEVEISDVRIHHNTIDVGIQPMQIREDYVYDPGPCNDNHSPIKNVSVHDNVYTRIARHSRRLTRRARITGLQNDFGQLSHGSVLNGSFQHKLAYWTADGSADCLTDSGERPADPAAAALAAETDGRVGHLSGMEREAALYQGLGLVDAVRYRLRARIAANADGVRLFVRDSRTGSMIAELFVRAGVWQEYELDFVPAGTGASYHVGVDRGTARTGWALIDWMQVLTLGETIEVDDPRISYAGEWRELRDVNLVGRAYVESTQAGAAATVTFDGTRARWFGLRDWIYGRGEAWVDGNPVGQVEGFNTGSWPAWVDHQVLLDTGNLRPGQHTIRLMCSADRHPESLGAGLALDAVVVDP